MLFLCSSLGSIPQAAVFHQLCQCPSHGLQFFTVCSSMVTSTRCDPCAPVVDAAGLQEEFCSTVVLHGLRGIPAPVPGEPLAPPSSWTAPRCLQAVLISLTPLSHSCHAAFLPFLRCILPEVLSSWLRDSTTPCGGFIGTGWSFQTSHSSSCHCLDASSRQVWLNSPGWLTPVVQAEVPPTARMSFLGRNESVSHWSYMLRWQIPVPWCPYVEQVNIQISLLMRFILVQSLVFIGAAWIFNVKIYFYARVGILIFSVCCSIPYNARSSGRAAMALTSMFPPALTACSLFKP